MARMTAAGAIMLGKTNTPAFGWIDVTGQPASSVPAGFTASGLPIVGRRLDDVTVLRASAAFERARPWAHEWPRIG